MSFKSITAHIGCDFLKGTRYNDIEPYGFDKSKTLGEMIDIAIENGCPIIIKAGADAKWYLKGKGRTIEYLKIKIVLCTGKERDDVVCFFIQ
jgi:hypothetical protein